ncbi:copper-transporting P-type ATPase [Paracoccidioides lutzii Pb01]|uniref:Copper-transporting P-type ATPase n=1 Tax=Paracoccidioides lutzii (strain ATCC MYA-826 / Pb01) TaxID=502779 RepID=C1H8R3_PARBA|nr:copper-transporting P-type ATPase [Paracoccidioides lutzii Pb01]EEH36736.1 copper-transporting P-type ATPase [Paracoccidioides lutzii Pb01]
MAEKAQVQAPQRAAHRSTPPDTPGSPKTITTVLLVNNIHCTSCVAYAREVLFGIPHVFSVDVSILTQEVHVRHSQHVSSTDLVRGLTDAAFEICHADSRDESGNKISDIDVSWPASRWIDRRIWSPGSHADKAAGSRKRAHIENCDACRLEEQSKYTGGDTKRLSSLSQPEVVEGKLGLGISNAKKQGDVETQEFSNKQYSDIDVEKGLVPSTEEYDAYISISGMSCASCVGTLTTAIKQLDFVKSVNIALLTHSATLTMLGPRENIGKVLGLIDDLGFEGTLENISEKLPRTSQGVFVATASIVGMTCGSCVGTITRGIQELPFVKNVAVDLLGASGKIEFEGLERLGDVIQAVKDLGYDIAVTECLPLNGDETQKNNNTPLKRTVAIKVDGMFCHHCPEKILNALESMEDESLSVDENLDLKKPVVTVTYKPDPPSMTVRSIIAAIESANPAFKATVYHPPTIEDRSRAMQLLERRRLLSRLLFTFIAAIPTFFIGIVWMSLVPPTNEIRKFFYQPIWAGTVSRLEWALFIITTPVMFYGADVFHVRAFKEVRALWRPSSRVPILRRFYRFGSMNLLISAGTSVAYFASLAVLAVGARSQGHQSHMSTYFDTVVFLTMFILAGRALEAYSKAKTGDAVSMLGKLRPSEALLVVDSPAPGPGDSPCNNIQRVSVDLLEVGDIVNIPHGASPPADGIVTSPGSYKFDQSSLTGESKPVAKDAGDKVYSGSVNVGQPVYIRVSDIGSTSMLDQIVTVVREGLTKRAPVEGIADIMTSYFVPVITLLAIMTFVIWLGLGLTGRLPDDYLDSAQGGWPFWALKFAIAVFVVACPCGLALAAPTALFVGGGLAAKRGILVRGGGEAFQEASRLGAIVFDKTGTLTEGGTLRVSDHEVFVSDQEQQQVAWKLAQVLEESSTHPIARAISSFCAEKSSISLISSTITEIPGQGMKGKFSMEVKSSSSVEQFVGIEYEAAIGSQRLLETLLSEEEADLYFLSNTLTKYQSEGKSTAILSIRKISDTSSTFTPAIVFATSDPIRAEAANVISSLQSKNIEVFMCSGDNSMTANAVASAIGIPASNVMANVLPQQKAEYIRQIQDAKLYNADATNNSKRTKQKRIVAFVGDGTNDSPALAAANVSIAMASGSDVAINSAGFILLNSELNTILELCTLSRRVFNRVKWNFGWAAVYNMLLVPIAAGILYPIVTGTMMGDDGKMVNKHWRLDPVWASLAMALSSVSVVCSSLALKIEWRRIRVWIEERVHHWRRG